MTQRSYQCKAKAWPTAKWEGRTCSPVMPREQQAQTPGNACVQSSVRLSWLPHESGAEASSALQASLYPTPQAPASSTPVTLPRHRMNRRRPQDGSTLTGYLSLSRVPAHWQANNEFRFC